MKHYIAALALLPLAACASSAPPPEPIVERGGKPYQFTADPGALVAVDIAFQRAVREQGFAKAAKDYAAKDAQLLLGKRIPLNSVGDGAVMLPAVVSTNTRQVLMSCDGRAAAVETVGVDSQGRAYVFLTIWNKVTRGAWRWTMMTVDDANAAPPSDTPVMTAIAKCGSSPPLAFYAPPVGVDMQIGMSPDQTLRWISYVKPNGASQLSVGQWDGTATVDKLTVSIP